MMDHPPATGNSKTTAYGQNDEALAHLLTLVRQRAGNRARRIVRNWHTAQDVVQEALIRAVVAQDQLQEIGNLEAWFCGVVHHLAVDRVRREVREREIMEALSAAGASDELFARPRAETLMQEEMRELLQEAMAQLRDDNRRVIELFYLQSQTLKQIAACLGVSQNTIKQRLSRARALLRHALSTLMVDAKLVHKRSHRKAILMKVSEPMSTNKQNIPAGWQLFGYKCEHYSITPDTTQRLTGSASVKIAADGTETEKTAGLMQRFPAAAWRGRRLLARLWVKGEGLGNDAFVAFLEAHDRQDIGHNVWWARCGGTFDWQALETVIEVQDTDGLLNLGFQVVGAGQVWVDRVEFEVTPDTMALGERYHSITWPTFTNLDFSDGAKALPATRHMLALAPGWYQVGPGPHERIFSLDPEMQQTGGASACIDHRQIPEAGLNRLYQRNPVDPTWRGKHLQMRGWVKTEGVERAGLWLRTDVGDAAVSLDDMQTRPLEGTREWTPCELVVAITPETTHLAYGSLLHGQGATWLDRIEFEVVGNEVPVTAAAVPPWKQPRTTVVNERATNLDFSEPVS